MGNICAGILEATHEPLNIREKESESSDSRKVNTKESVNLQGEQPFDQQLNLDKECRFRKEEEISHAEILKGFDQNQKNFIYSAFKRMNEYRRRHGAPELKLNPGLCETSKKFAEDVAQHNQIFHSAGLWSDKPIGECMAIMIGKELTGKEMVDIWYDEKDNFDFKKPDYKENSGYFSQMVWKGSKEVGIGVAEGPENKWVGIANFYPAGNSLGQYQENVLPETS